MAPVLTEIRSLLGAISARSDETERLGRVPADVLDDLTASGALRVHVPTAYGGIDADLSTGMHVLEALATADASVAWTLLGSWEGTAALSRLAPATRQALYRAGPDLVIGWSPAVKGVACADLDGYRVSGRWPILRGLGDPRWIVVNCGVADAPYVGLGADRLPATLAVVVPGDAPSTAPGYHVPGLHGAGGIDIRLHDAFVPPERIASHPDARSNEAPVVSAIPDLARYSCRAGAIALGIAQGALSDVATGLGRGWADSSRAGTIAATSLRQASVALHAARLALYDHADLLCTLGPDITHAHADAARTTGSWVVAMAGTIVSSAYELGASGPHSTTSSIARRFRDVHTLGPSVTVGQDQLTSLTRPVEVETRTDLDLDLVPA